MFTADIMDSFDPKMLVLIKDIFRTINVEKMLFIVCSRNMSIVQDLVSWIPVL